ncbi:MAG: Enoyl-CoA hydratase/isomerase, partial [Pseudonocardiales bacterium]|nr:Enoyl-CoA hydratase/isomerase [Pseudonocardiales bacterium]
MVRIISSEEDEQGTIHREDHAEVATLTLGRGRFNAITGAFADQLVTALGECGADPAVRAIVLTGAGRSFSVGAD